MHESMMAQNGMDHDHHQQVHESEEFGNDGGWGDIHHNYSSSPQHQSPLYEQSGFTFTQPFQQNTLPTEQAFSPHRMPIPHHSQTHTTHQPLLPLIMPSHQTWPSMLTNPATYSTPPVAISSTVAPLVKGNSKKQQAHHPISSPRKTLTDSDRRRMCQYHEENPSVKQTEIGAMFGVERSTVSKVLCKKDKYLLLEDRSLSPIKRAKGNKFPDIDRALANWVRKSQREGRPVTDEDIKEQARHFAANVHPVADSHLKTNSATWLEKFKQKNKIGDAKLTRKASETSIPDSSFNPESARPSASQTPKGTSPTSPKGTSSSSPVSTTRSEEDLNSKRRDGVRYLSQEKGGYRHSNSQSTTSLSSAFDTGPTSPTTPFTFSPDPGNSWLSLQPSQSHPPGTSFQRPRSQTFPMLGIDPSLISSSFNEPLTPKYSLPGTAPSSSLDSPSHEMPSSFVLDSALDESNESAMGPQPHTTTSGLQSPPVSVGLSSPTQDDARRALETFLSFVTQSPNRLVDENEYMTVVKLTERLRLQPNGDLPGGLHRIAEQDCEPTAPKMEQSMSVGC
ncbi:centromere binding protein B [Diplocarpon rosae]|nr:centromere binding protein B [Diplocarpon rosae]